MVSEVKGMFHLSLSRFIGMFIAECFRLLNKGTLRAGGAIWKILEFKFQEIARV